MTHEETVLRQKVERIQSLAEEIGRLEARLERLRDESNDLKYAIQISYLSQGKGG